MGEVFFQHAAVEQGRQRNTESLRDLRNLLQRGRTLAALQPAKVQLGHFELLRNLLLGILRFLAGGADIQTDGLIGNEHGDPSMDSRIRSSYPELAKITRMLRLNLWLDLRLL